MRKADIIPQIWQENNRRWATPQHYTCSYMAMFPPALPHYFIRKFTEVNDIVLDPFSGRGTTALEAIAQGRIGIGNDLNDLAYVLTKGKLANPDISEVSSRLSELEKQYFRSEWVNFSGMPNKIRMIFHPETQKQLMYLRRELDWKNNAIDSFLTMILMGAIHGQSSGFLSIRMPNTFSMSPNYVKEYISKNNLKRPNRDVFDVIRHRCERVLKNGKLPGHGFSIHGDARKIDELKQINHNSIKMIFSSPPYLKVIKYGQYNWIRLWWLIGEHKSVDKKLDDSHSVKPYLIFMKEVLESTLKLLDKKSGLACWVIGDVNGLNLAELVWDQVGSKIEIFDSNNKLISYRLLGIISDEINDSEKVTKIWNSESDKSGKATPIDRILLICPNESVPIISASNDQITWNQTLDYN